MRRTAKYDLLQVRLGRDLARYVETAYGEGRSWRSIAADLSAATGVAVTHETLRSWFPAIKAPVSAGERSA